MKSTISLLLTIAIVFFASSQASKLHAQTQNDSEQKSANIEKEESISYDDFIADLEIRSQYIRKLLTLNSAIIRENYNLLYNYEKTALHLEEERNELAYRGRIPYVVKLKGKELEDDKNRIKSKIEELKNDKDDLRMDALKYYRGKLPLELKKAWNEQEKNYIEDMDKYLEDFKNFSRQ